MMDEEPPTVKEEVRSEEDAANDASEERRDESGEPAAKSARRSSSVPSVESSVKAEEPTDGYQEDSEIQVVHEKRAPNRARKSMKEIEGASDSATGPQSADLLKKLTTANREVSKLQGLLAASKTAEETLQQELQQAQATIEQLTRDNEKLTSLVGEKDESRGESAGGDKRQPSEDQPMPDEQSVVKSEKSQADELQFLQKQVEADRREREKVAGRIEKIKEQFKADLEKERADGRAEREEIKAELEAARELNRAMAETRIGKAAADVAEAREKYNKLLEKFEIQEVPIIDNDKILELQKRCSLLEKSNAKWKNDVFKGSGSNPGRSFPARRDNPFSYNRTWTAWQPSGFEEEEEEEGGW